MKFSKRLLPGLIVTFLSACISSTGFAAVIFKDDFESGGLLTKLTASLTTALWGDHPQVSVTADRAVSGSRASKFHFGSDSNWAELRFDLGKVYPEVWLSISMYVPSNYVHRVGGDGPNNKLLRLWGSDYNNWEKVGYSTWPDNGLSSAAADWGGGGPGVGPKGQWAGNFIGSSDLGKWMKIKVQAKAATSSTPGTLRLWKNGVLVLNDSNALNNYTEGEPHGYRYGYLLGAANSGFAATTDIYIDDVVFATTEADLGDTQTHTPQPPGSIVVQ